MAKQELRGYSPTLLEDVQRRLTEVDVSPNEGIGQHFLVNQEAVDLLAQTVNQGATVIEVGCGVGHVTERLAERASRLHGIEIDRRYHPLLEKIMSARSNVFITYADALKTDFNRMLKDDNEGQIVASLPYHITEPFMHKVSPLKLASVSLVMGRRYADSIAASFNSGDFGRLSILTTTFFDVETLATIQRDGFFPIPRTDSAIVQLRPRDVREVGSNRKDAIFRHLFLTSRQNTTLRKGLKEGFDAFEQSRDGMGLSKEQRNRKSRSNTRLRLKSIVDSMNRGEIDFSDRGGRDRGAFSKDISAVSRNAIGKLDIPHSVLDKPFSLLNNSELRMLYKSLG
ncbi:hypothetical protein HYS96_03700 [Candidatus Daviesbacteria bacterium]|nr:hypothetical protein [Candidatus Daviesbacteria bacterium]